MIATQTNKRAIFSVGVTASPLWEPFTTGPISWQQYNELGGIGATGSKSRPYITDLQVLDGEMPQYIADNNNSSVDTSWWVRYRSTTNPDLGAIYTHQAVQGLNVGQLVILVTKCRPHVR